MAAGSQRTAISRLGRSKAARSFLDIPRGAGFAARSDSGSPPRGSVIFGSFELRAIFSRAAIHGPILGVGRGRAVHAAFRGPIRAGDRSQYRSFHVTSADFVSNRFLKSSRQSPQRFAHDRLRRADWNGDRVQASRSAELVSVDRPLSDFRHSGKTTAQFTRIRLLVDWWTVRDRGNHWPLFLDAPWTERARRQRVHP